MARSLLPWRRTDELGGLGNTLGLHNGLGTLLLRVLDRELRTLRLLLSCRQRQAATHTRESVQRPKASAATECKVLP
jgi:hypothetical protein